MKFTDHMHALIEERKAGRNTGIFDYNGKAEGRRLAQELGVPVPGVVMDPFEPEDFPYPPHVSVVVKPSHGSFSRGVLPLERNEAGDFRVLWEDVRSPGKPGEAVPWYRWMMALQQIRDGFEGVEGREIRGPWIAEELIPGLNTPLATIWKVYCLWGRPVWARQLTSDRRRGGVVQCWRIHEGHVLERGFQGEFLWSRPIGAADDDVQVEPERFTFERLTYDVFLNHPLQAVGEIPTGLPGHVYGYARVLALTLLKRTESPFVRVDLLEGARRVYFGEITPHPSGGNDVYQPELDKELGAIWSRGPR